MTNSTLTTQNLIAHDLNYLLDQAFSGVVCFYADGRLAYANESARTLLNLSGKDAWAVAQVDAQLAADFGVVDTQNRPFRLQDVLELVSADGRHVQTTTRWQATDSDTFFWLDIDARAVGQAGSQKFDDNGNPGAYEVMLLFHRVSHETAVILESYQPKVTGDPVVDTAWQAWRRQAPQLVNLAKLLVTLLTPDGKILYLNPYSEALLQYRLDEVAGKNWFDIFVPSPAQKAGDNLLAAFAGEPRAHGDTLTVVTKSGALLDIDWYVQLLADENGRVEAVIGFGHEVTQKIEAQQKLIRYSTQLEILQKIDNAVLAVQPPEIIGQIAVQELKKLLGCYSVSVALLAEVKGRYEILAVAEDRAGGLQAGHSFAYDRVALRKMFADGAPVVVQEPTVLQEMFELFPEGKPPVPLSTVVLAPLFVGQELIGTLNLTYTADDNYRKLHREIAGQAALSIAVAMQNGRLLQQAKKQAELTAQSNSLMKALNDVTLAISANNRVQDVIHALGEALEAIDLHAAVALGGPDVSSFMKLSYVSLANEIVENIAHKFGISPSVFEIPFIPFSREKPVFVSNPREIAANILASRMKTEDAMQLLTQAAMNKTTSALALPLYNEAEFLGYTFIWGESLIEEHLSIFSSFSNQVAFAIYKAILLQKERKAKDRAETMRQVARLLNASLDMQKVLQLILEQLNRIINFDSASIMLLVESELEIVARSGISSGVENWPALNLDTLPGLQLVLEKQSPIIIPDTHLDENWTRLPEDDHIRSWLGVPLNTQDETIGILNLNNGIAGYYTPQDAQWALAFANQAALAIANARLFSQTQEHAAQLESEVHARTRDLLLLYDVTAAISQNLPIETKLKSILEQLLTAYRVDGAAVYSLVSSPIASHTWQMSARAGDVPAALLSGNNQKLSALIPDLKTESDPELMSGTINWQADKCDLKMVLYHYLHARGSIVGILLLVADTIGTLNLNDRALLLTISDHVGNAIENEKLRQKSEELAVVAERERLARELHDSVTQGLYSLSLFAQAARERIDKGEHEQAGAYVKDIGVTAHQALKEMRLLLYELRSATLLQDGLAAALQHRLDAVEGRANIKARLIMNKLERLEPTMEETLFRIAQEGMNNALKHSLAQKLIVRISQTDEQIEMEITDNGIGFDVNSVSQSGGMGLEIIAERVRKLNGNLTIKSALKVGTTLEIQLPLNTR